MVMSLIISFDRHIILVMFMFYLINFWIKFDGLLPIFTTITTIQKPYLYRQFSTTSFAATLKPNVFDGANYKCWRAKMMLWLTAMNVIHVAQGKPEGPLSPNVDKTFEADDNLFRGAVISVIGENIVDSNMSYFTRKELWDALEAKYGVSHAGSELYVMELYHDYKMVDDRSVVEQDHEILSLTKELKNLKCVLSDTFVAGCMIAKLLPSWRNYATILKHKKQEFTMMDLIGTLDVEEKARVKDTRTKIHEAGTSNVNIMQKNFQFHKKKSFQY